MPILLFRLNGVPDDEADELREKLREGFIDFYETSAGRWGISMAGIWLKDDSGQEARARAIIDAYQEQRAEQAQADYAERLARGEVESLAQRIAREPLKFIFYLLAIMLVLYLTLMPFLGW